MSEPRWIRKRALILFQEACLAAHGGATGMRDEGLLDSALARPTNRFHYHADADIPDLAAAYAFGLVKNHPFFDGNKRVAFGAVGIFLMINGVELQASEADAITAVVGLAAGNITEEEFAAWIRANCKERS